MPSWTPAEAAKPARLSVEDLAELNRWLCVTRLRAAAGVFACSLAMRWLAPAQLALLPLLAVCVGLCLVSAVGLATPAAKRAPWTFFYAQSAADLGAITIGIWAVAGPLEGIIFRFIYALVVVPVGLVSVTGGLVVAGLASLGHLGLLGRQHGFSPATFGRVEAIAYPFLFFLVAQQCF